MCTQTELLTIKNPNLSNIQFFGCDAYVKTLSQIKKWNDRCKRYMYACTYMVMHVINIDCATKWKEN